jgi:hypothetical protein
MARAQGPLQALTTAALVDGRTACVDVVLLGSVAVLDIDHVMHVAAREVPEESTILEIEHPVIESADSPETLSRIRIASCPKRSQ